MNSIIKELKRKRESRLDESAEDLKYEEVYSSGDISNIEKFKSDVEGIGGKVIVKGDELTAVVPHEQKVALKDIEGKYFDGVDEAAGSKTSMVKRRMAGAGRMTGTGRDMESETEVAVSKKGRVIKSLDPTDLEKGLLKCAKKYKMKNLQKEYDLVATYLSNLYSSSNSKFEKQMVEKLFDGEVISKKDLFTLLMRGCGEDYFLDLVVDESLIDEAFGVGSGFENVLTISGSREELNAIARKCGVDIRDVKLNRVAEKQFLDGNSFGIGGGSHLVVLTKDKKHAGNLMLVIDKGEYIPDAIPINESAKKFRSTETIYSKDPTGSSNQKVDSNKAFEILTTLMPEKEYEDIIKIISKDKKAIKELERFVNDEKINIDKPAEIDYFATEFFDFLNVKDNGLAIMGGDYPYVFKILNALKDKGLKIDVEIIKKVSNEVFNTRELKKLNEWVDYFMGKLDESAKEVCYEMEIPMEDLVDEDGEEIDVEEVLEAAKSCKGVNEAEALEDCIRIRYDESCEKELVEKLEECGINADIEEE